MSSQNSSIIVTDQNLATNWTSNPLNIRSFSGVAFQFVMTGTLAGTFKYQVSNDFNAVVSGESNTADVGRLITNFVDLTDNSDVLLSDPIISSDTIASRNFAALNFRWIRVVYTASSGTGTMTATLHLKG